MGWKQSERGSGMDGASKVPEVHLEETELLFSHGDLVKMTDGMGALSGWYWIQRFF